MMRYLLGFCVCLLVMISCVEQNEAISVTNIPTGFEAMAKIENLPLLYPSGTKKNRIVSYDASGGNGFGLFLSMFKKYVDSNGEIVFFDAYGPGCLYRQQINIWKDNGIGANNKNIRIKYYFDNEKEPRIDLPVFEFFNGEHSPVTTPFAFRQKEQFGVIYYPFTFEKRLKITLSDPALTRLVEEKMDNRCNWYQFDYLTYPSDVKVKTWSAGVDEYEEKVRMQWNNLGKDPKSTEGNEIIENTLSLNPGEEKVLFEQEGKASITGIKLKINPFTPESFYKTKIKIEFDDLAKPAVDLPISYFFGGGGIKDNKWNDSLKTLLYGFDSKEQTAYCYWPMPFWEKAVIRVVNESNEKIDSLYCRVDWKSSEAINYFKKGTGYFKVKLTEDVSVGGESRKDFTKPYANAFKERGHGHVVAINMWSGNFYEDGDEFTYIDGNRTPQIHGDGTEDDFNQGWAGARYQQPVWGALENGVKGAYRIHLNEPYIYYHSIDMRFEYTNSIYGGIHPRKRQGTENENIETEFVVWYYQSASEPALILTDSLDVGNLESEKLHSYSIIGRQIDKTLTQSYDSYESCDDFDCVTDSGYLFDGVEEFSVNISSKNKGVRLRKRIDRNGNGIQEAVVYVDGVELPTPWYILSYSGLGNGNMRSFDGWLDSEYEIPAVYTQGKERINIRVKHIKSVKNELNSYFYWIYSYSNI